MIELSSAGLWASQSIVPGVLGLAFHAVHPQVTESAVPHYDDILRVPMDRGAAKSDAVLCYHRGSPVLKPIYSECALDDDTLR